MSEPSDPNLQILPNPTEPQPKPVRPDFLTRIGPHNRHLLEQAKYKAKAKRAELAQLALIDKIQSQPQPPPPSNSPSAPPPDPFVLASLAKCRAQLDRLYKAIDDPQLAASEIDKLASAIARFSEIERNLAMRPGPGTLKPAGEPVKQTRASWLLSGDDEQVSTGTGKAGTQPQE